LRVDEAMTEPNQETGEILPAKDVVADNAKPRGVPGPSTNPATNLLIADIVLRGASTLFRKNVEKGMAKASENEEEAREILNGRTILSTLALYGASKLATRSVPGLAVVAGGLLVKTLYDRGNWEFALENVLSQLAAFKRDEANAGKVMDRGVWAWSRHPNYFGNTLIWWGLFLIAASDMASLWTVVGPILMTWLILKVSGVVMLEKGLRQSRPGYETYIARTSAFIPLPPRK